MKGDFTNFLEFVPGENGIGRVLEHVLSRGTKVGNAAFPAKMLLKAMPQKKDRSPADFSAGAFLLKVREEPAFPQALSVSQLDSFSSGSCVGKPTPVAM